jgi:plastocyanin
MNKLSRAFVALVFCTAGCSNEAPPQQTEIAKTPEASVPSQPVQGSVAGRVPVSSGQPSIVVLEPRQPQKFPPQTEKPVMDQVALTFLPGLLLVRTGQPAEFRNSDDVLHNVRVNEYTTKAGTFNVAIPLGEEYIHTFERDGFYDVGCDIHPAMTATIFASSSPYSVVTDPSGEFRIHDVPPGPYTAVVYAGAERIERPIEVVAGETGFNLTP